MSGVRVLAYLFKQNAALTAQVAATKIFASAVPLATVLPAIGLEEISSIERLTVSMREAKRMHTERVQVTVQAKTYASQKTILALVRAAAVNQRATIDGVEVDSILPDNEGPDLAYIDDAIYTQSIDFIVKYLA